MAAGVWHEVIGAFESAIIDSGVRTFDDLYSLLVAGVALGQRRTMNSAWISATKQRFIADVLDNIPASRFSNWSWTAFIMYVSAIDHSRASGNHHSRDEF